MDRSSLSQLGVLSEPPCAESHAGWCGGWRLDTSGYPIMRHYLLRIRPLASGIALLPGAIDTMRPSGP